MMNRNTTRPTYPHTVPPDATRTELPSVGPLFPTGARQVVQQASIAARRRFVACSLVLVLWLVFLLWMALAPS